MYDGVTYLPDASFWQAVIWHWLPPGGLTCHTLIERITPRHKYSKATIRKTNANRQYWRVNTPLSNFQYFRALKIATQLRTHRISSAGTVNHVKDEQLFSLQMPFTLHWRCNISENLLFEIVPQIHHQFVSKLEFRVLVLVQVVVVELFSISRLQRASSHSLCALF